MQVRAASRISFSFLVRAAAGRKWLQQRNEGDLMSNTFLVVQDLSDQLVASFRMKTVQQAVSKDWLRSVLECSIWVKGLWNSVYCSFRSIFSVFESFSGHHLKVLNSFSCFANGSVGKAKYCCRSFVETIIVLYQKRFFFKWFFNLPFGRKKDISVVQHLGQTNELNRKKRFRFRF